MNATRFTIILIAVAIAAYWLTSYLLTEPPLPDSPEALAAAIRSATCLALITACLIAAALAGRSDKPQNPQKPRRDTGPDNDTWPRTPPQ